MPLFESCKFIGVNYVGTPEEVCKAKEWQAGQLCNEIRRFKVFRQEPLRGQHPTRQEF